MEEPGAVAEGVLPVPPRRPHQDADALPRRRQADFNVPLIGGEQMYQALRSMGVDTQLVIYPGQHHGITTPSYSTDRLRALSWPGTTSI